MTKLMQDLTDRGILAIDDTTVQQLGSDDPHEREAAMYELQGQTQNTQTLSRAIGEISHQLLLANRVSEAANLLLVATECEIPYASGILRRIIRQSTPPNAPSGPESNTIRSHMRGRVWSILQYRMNTGNADDLHGIMADYYVRFEGDYDAALQYCESAMAMDDPEAYLIAGDILSVRKHDYDTAIQCYTVAHELTEGVRIDAAIRLVRAYAAI